MSWNYRLVKYPTAEEGMGLHEVYYDAEGRENGMSKPTAGFVGDSAEEIILQLERAIDDIRKRPLFTPPSEWWNR